MQGRGERERRRERWEQREKEGETEGEGERQRERERRVARNDSTIIMQAKSHPSDNTIGVFVSRTTRWRLWQQSSAAVLIRLRNTAFNDRFHASPRRRPERKYGGGWLNRSLPLLTCEQCKSGLIRPQIRTTDSRIDQHTDFHSLTMSPWLFCPFRVTYGLLFHLASRTNVRGEGIV